MWTMGRGVEARRWNRLRASFAGQELETKELRTGDGRWAAEMAKQIGIGTVA